MANNAQLGMTIQKLICEKYNIVPTSQALSQFEAAYNADYKGKALKAIDRIFEELNLLPTECLTFTPSENIKEKFSPHNFLLSNGTTLSIRTNLNGDKVAPRVVGQPGINTFNEHFSSIVDCEIEGKEDIKKVVFDNIHLMMPIFIDYLFLSDYTVWIQLDNNDELAYTIFDKNSFVDINLSRDNFSFTRDCSTWIESTTLKYNGKSIAEIQIHKNRTFKFRFIMNTVSELLVEQKKTNETFGITAEKVVCDISGIVAPPEYRKRYSIPLSHKIRPVLEEAFKELPKAIKSTGTEKGIRGANSKCPYDFILEGEKTLSLKTNTGKMICPPEVGQPNAETCYLYFKDYIDGTEVTADSFKAMVLKHISEIIHIYIQHLFDSDYLLWLYQRGDHFEFKIYNSDFAKNMKWNHAYFEFTKPTIEEWNESNTVKYCGISIGEFQVHKNRSCFKFRFNMENFDHLINSHCF